MRTARVSRRGATRWLARLHPWIYRSDVVQPPGSEADAGVVRVVDERDAVVGMALWSPASTISLRMLTTDEQSIDEGFWRDRIAQAIAYRARLAPDADAFRLVHAEADGLPGLIVDRYGDVLVAQFLSAGIERLRDVIVAALRAQLEPRGILARDDVPIRSHERLGGGIAVLYGEVPDGVEVREAGIRSIAAVRSGQKTGAFLDQRENRVRAGQLASGRALDCFSYHGSFALHMAGRATHVTAVESSADALARACDNARLNGIGNIEFLEGNVFDVLRAFAKTGENFDIIVLDPPAFAKRKDSVSAAARGYKEINLRALQLLAPGGYLCTFSCSYHVSHDRFRTILADAAADARRPVRWIEARTQSPDHPAVLQIPESDYLKGAILQAAGGTTPNP